VAVDVADEEDRPGLGGGGGESDVEAEAEDIFFFLGQVMSKFIKLGENRIGSSIIMLMLR